MIPKSSPVSMLTATNLMQLDALASEDVDDGGFHPAVAAAGSDSGSSAAFDSDEERMDRLMTPTEMREVEAACDEPDSDPRAFEKKLNLSKIGRRLSCEMELSLKSISGDGDKRAPTVWYFAYGSNMNVAQLLTRIGGFREKTLMFLPDHRLVFNKKVSLRPQSRSLGGDPTAKCGFANVVPAKGERVYGIAYAVDAFQVEKMDVYEGVGRGHYDRKTMTCYDSDLRPIPCEVYIACAGATSDGLLPSAGYLSHLLGGRGLLPPAYTEMLLAQETVRRH